LIVRIQIAIYNPRWGKALNYSILELRLNV
jgi:hypothetical protein